MSRIIYNVEGLFVGPSGNNFLNYAGGDSHNDYSDTVINDNLIKQLDRVQALSYDISIPHHQVTQLNTRSVVDRPIINPPEVSFSFSYLVSDVSNEAKMGLYVNHPRFEHPYEGAPLFSNNTGQSLISGFAEDDETKDGFKDKKNFYLVVRSDKEDLNQTNNDSLTSLEVRDANGLIPPTSVNIGDPPYHNPHEDIVDMKSSGHNVIAFGNCYMTSYSTEASIGDFPRVDISYVSENVMFYTSGSGFATPTIETKSGTQISGVECVIPKMKARNPISVIRPGDIDFSVDSFSGLGIDFNNLHLESYSINFDLPREAQTSLGYKFPISRKLNYTIPVQIGINGVVEKMSSGSLIDLVQLNQDYNFTVNLNRSQECSAVSTDSPRHAGVLGLTGTEPLIKYPFNKAKLDSFDYDTSIGSSKQFSAIFSTELDPDNLTKGFFISGLLGDRVIEDFHLLENSSGINFDGVTYDVDRFHLQLEESEDLLVSNDVRLY